MLKKYPYLTAYTLTYFVWMGLDYVLNFLVTFLAVVIFRIVYVPEPSDLILEYFALEELAANLAQLLGSAITVGVIFYVFRWAVRRFVVLEVIFTSGESLASRRHPYFKAYILWLSLQGFLAFVWVLVAAFLISVFPITNFLEANELAYLLFLAAFSIADYLMSFYLYKFSVRRIVFSKTQTPEKPLEAQESLPAYGAISGTKEAG